MLKEMSYIAPSDAALWNTALRFMRENRVTAYRAMKRDGELDEYLQDKVAAAKDYAANLILSGTWAGEAWNQAVRAILLESDSD